MTMSINDYKVRTRNDGLLEVDADLNFTSGDSIDAGQIGLNTIHYSTGGTGKTAGQFVGGVAVTNSGSYGNSASITAYENDGGLAETTGDSDFIVTFVGE